MVFSGYRLPKPIEKAGTVVGTDPSARYTVGAKDPALYRNILTLDLASATSPGVPTTTSLSSSDEGSGDSGAQVTYTATVSPVAPGTGTPTGTVSFSDSSGPISECSAQPLSLETPDTATCVTHHGHAGSDEVTASYSGDSNYAASSASISETVDEAPAITSPDETTFTENEEGEFMVIATGTPTPTIAETGTLPAGVTFSDGVLSGTPTQRGTFPITFTADNGVGEASVQHFTLTVLGLHITTTSLPEATPGAHYSFRLQAEGGIATYHWSETGALPASLRLSAKDVLSGKVRAQAAGSFPITVTVTDHHGKKQQTATASLTLTVP